MDELKACPFCENDNDYEGRIKHEPSCYMEIRDDESVLPSAMKHAWHNRPIEDALREQLEQERMPEDVKNTCEFVLNWQNSRIFEQRLQHALDWLKKRRT